MDVPEARVQVSKPEKKKKSTRPGAVLKPASGLGHLCPRPSHLPGFLLPLLALGKKVLNPWILVGEEWEK